MKNLQDLNRFCAPAVKEWYIRSPEGVAYKFINLHAFCRNNKNLFNTFEEPDLWERAARGITHLHRAPYRKRIKNPPTHWRGWTIVSYLESSQRGRDLLDRYPVPGMDVLNGREGI